MAAEEPNRSGTTVIVYKDGKQVEIPVEEFLRALEDLHG